LSFRQSLQHVILPHAGKRVVQPLADIAIALTMATALAGVVGVVDMTRAAQRIKLEPAQPLLVSSATWCRPRVLERRLA
jgi:glutamate transport system permease protein